ncbi:hypothetical protein PHYSODRAFT_325655 [Phytophthora sojae]|uniref:Uncharacterized protein n=1 Tax=Phytophthora sojae (strain P6497) TaxID=1094619 RepID=G4YXQ8_PHYSP|nr:hypothetical protein PHYSODRAFT_325655 [Phytophthora sojae]EGZ24547.1 hypothetical protein PHYSODRAFT_325655 [Phytophthora sojae]|eukprot:XP_009519835.1 hypothetical protein PHYSODRAFT_325655 [Phytophthora sojae]
MEGRRMRMSGGTSVKDELKFVVEARPVILDSVQLYESEGDLDLVNVFECVAPDFWSVYTGTANFLFTKPFSRLDEATVNTVPVTVSCEAVVADIHKVECNLVHNCTRTDAKSEIECLGNELEALDGLVALDELCAQRELIGLGVLYGSRTVGYPSSNRTACANNSERRSKLNAAALEQSLMPRTMLIATENNGSAQQHAGLETKEHQCEELGYVVAIIGALDLVRALLKHGSL